MAEKLYITYNQVRLQARVVQQFYGSGPQQHQQLALAA
jgi:hypothetical protein